MPLDTTGDGWTRGDPAASLHEQVVAFLEKNERWAFHARELADEILDTDWELAHRRERERRRLGDDEFNERLENGDLKQLGQDSGGKALADSIQTEGIIAICNALARDGELAVREVPPEESNIPGDDGDPIRYFTYAAD